jgi:hypothetical protein
MKKTEFCGVFFVMLAVVGMTFTACPQAGDDTSHTSLSDLAGKWEMPAKSRDFIIESDGDFTADIAINENLGGLKDGKRTKFAGKISFTDEMDVHAFQISELTATNNPTMDGTLTAMNLNSFAVELTRTGDTLNFNGLGNIASATNEFFGGDYTRKK